MNYTIMNNEQFNSLEIMFDGKPSEEIRTALKDLKFRWHGVKKCWYGYSTEEAVKAAIEGKASAKPEAQEKAQKATAVNKYGVQVGDIFWSSWGYEQTNNDFFQVIELVGSSSVRVREVYPEIVTTSAVSSMSEDRTLKISRDLLPPVPHSVFIKDQERGDLKRLKSYAADGVSNPQFYLSSFTDAHYLAPGQIKTVYDSWYY